MRLVRLSNEPAFSDMVNNFFEREASHFFPSRYGSHVPSTNIVEKDDAFELEIAAPGLQKEQFKITVENNILSISSEKEEEKEETTKNYTRREFAYGAFKRSFSLPKSVNIEKISADYAEGILKINLPKKQEDISNQKREINVG